MRTPRSSTGTGGRLDGAIADARKGLDRAVIAELNADGGEARYKAGEFAATEISLAVHSSKFTAQRTMALTHRP
jgi:hypothetical protein